MLGFISELGGEDTEVVWDAIATVRARQLLLLHLLLSLPDTQLSFALPRPLMISPASGGSSPSLSARASSR